MKKAKKIKKNIYKNTDKVSLEEMMKGVTRDQMHELVDWGPDVGKEIILQFDKWGDEGKWENVVDFTKIKKGGVSGKGVLKSF